MTDENDDFDSKVGRAYGLAVPRALRTANGRLYLDWMLLLDDLGQCSENVRLTERIDELFEEQHRRG